MVKRGLEAIKAFLKITWPFALAGAIVGVIPGYKAYDYVWNDADFCLSCHVHDYVNVAWKNSVHGELTTCHDCHHLGLHEYALEMYVMIKDRPKFPKDLKHVPKVPKNLCQACHLSNPEDRSTVTGPLSIDEIDKLPKVDKTYLHRLHLGEKTKLREWNTYPLKELEGDEADKLQFHRDEGEERSINCMDCHGGPSNRAHNFSATDASCVRCHDTLHATKIGKEFGCRNCHFPGFMLPALDGSEKH